MTAKKLTDAEIGAWAGTIRAVRSALENIETALKAADLPPLAFYDVLLELGRDPAGRLRLNELGGRVLLSKSNVTRLVDRLEAEGLVAREACEDDARGAFAVITPEGRALTRRMWPVYHDTLRACFLDHLDGRETARLAELMRRIAVANR
jgi:DNA-binding MarR family transcriptional regulator